MLIRAVGSTLWDIVVVNAFTLGGFTKDKEASRKRCVGIDLVAEMVRL